MTNIQLKHIAVSVILLSTLAYLLLHTSFNIYFEDDSWTLSNAWNYSQYGVNEDLVFLDSDALGRQQYFGKLYYIICGAFFNFLGWTKTSAFLLNSIFIAMSSLIWWLILKKMPFSKTVAKLFVLFLPLFPPFFFAAHTGRTDAMTFFLISFMLLQFVHRRYILTGLLLTIAIETHIMGAIGGFYLLAFTLYKKEELLYNFKELQMIVIQFTTGLFLGISYYLILHGGTFSLDEITKIVQSKQDMHSPLNNYILSYFTDFDWKHHIWEFVLLIYTSFLYIKHKLYKKNKFLTILLIILVISTFITRRENRTYFIFIFPAFLLMVFYTFEQTKNLPLFTKALCVTLFLSFGSTYYLNGTYKFDQISNQIKSQFVKRELPVVGMPDIWFASQERTFYPIHTHRNFNNIYLDHFYLVETDYLAYRNRVYPYLMNYLLENYDHTLVKTISAGNEREIKIHECKSRINFKPVFIKQSYPGWQAILSNYFTPTNIIDK